MPGAGSRAEACGCLIFIGRRSKSFLFSNSFAQHCTALFSLNLSGRLKFNVSFDCLPNLHWLNREAEDPRWVQNLL